MSDRPNILVLMTDQQHFSTLEPDSPCRTPNLDRLAARGCRFTHAFTPIPMCTPARSSFQTGLLPHQHKLIHNAHHGKNCHLLGDFLPGVHLLGDELHEVDYHTAYFGKWDSGLQRHPDSYGYELYRSGASSSRSPGEFVQTEQVVIPGEPNARRALISCRTTRPAAETGCFGIAALIDGYLEELPDDGQPFYIFASCTEPHVPWICPVEFADLYDAAALPEWPDYRDDFHGRPAAYRREYNMHNYCHLPGNWPAMARAIAHHYGVVTMIDAAVGQMLDSLRRHGQLDRTTILFTSDHGEHLGHHGLVGKGANLLDDLLRIPLLLAPAGGGMARQCDRLVSLTDGFATLLDIAESATLPPPTSRSLMPLVRGEATDAFPDQLFFEHHGTQLFDCLRGVRSRRYKYIFRAHDQDEFYDLEDDPCELRNRIADPACAAAVRSLQDALIDHLESTRDPAATGARLRLRLPIAGRQLGEASPQTDEQSGAAGGAG